MKSEKETPPTGSEFYPTNDKEKAIYKIKYWLRKSYCEFEICEKDFCYNDNEFIDVVFYGTIKWDGCSNWSTDNECMLHICGLPMLNNFNNTIKRCYEIGKELMGDDCE